MSVRPEALANRIARNLVTMLENHAATYPELWARKPKTIKRFRGTAMATLPRPSIFVATQDTSQIEQRPAGATDSVHWARGKVLLTLMTEDQSDPQGAIVDLRADVCRALSGNRNMAGVDDGDGSGLVVQIVIGDDQLEAIDDDPGDGICDLIVFVDYKWTKDEP